jgi:hypothetical protein
MRQALPHRVGRAELNLYLREARWMADKHIAHLTSDRTADVDLKIWDVEPIVRSLVPIHRTLRERRRSRLRELP